jgi:hypothetical protein
MVDERQMENVEYYKYLHSIIPHYRRRTCEIKFRITVAKDLNLRSKLAKCYIRSIALYGAESWSTSGSRSEIYGKF